MGYMSSSRISDLIKEKIESTVNDNSIRDFIYELIDIEQEFEGPRGKLKEYEEKLHKYAGRDAE